MNPVETLIYNQLVTHERLQWVIGLLVADAAMSLAGLALGIWVLSVKMRTRDDIAAMKDVLVLVKLWAYSAKSNADESLAAAKRALDMVKEHATAQAARGTQIARAMDELPERTAQLTADRVASAQPPP